MDSKHGDVVVRVISFGCNFLDTKAFAQYSKPTRLVRLVNCFNMSRVLVLH